MDVFYDSDADPEDTLLSPGVPTMARLTVEREATPLRESNDYDGNDDDDDVNDDGGGDDDKDDEQNPNDDTHPDTNDVKSTTSKSTTSNTIYDKNGVETESEEKVDTPDDKDVTESATKLSEGEEEGDAKELLMPQTPEGRFIPIEFPAEDEEEGENKEDDEGNKEDVDSKESTHSTPSPPPPSVTEQDQDDNVLPNQPQPGLHEFLPPPPPPEQGHGDQVLSNQSPPGLHEFLPPPPDQSQLGLHEFPPPPPGQLTVYPVDEGGPTIDVHNQYF